MKPRVLLIDARGASANLAERLGASPHIEFVGRAEGLSDAMRMLREKHPDVLLMDVHQWNGTAVELCHQLRQVATIPLAVLASSMTPERWRSLREAGATELFLKRVDTAQLSRELATLGTTIGQRRGASAQGGST